MATRFDVFMNAYDKENNGKYSYYYRKIWDAFHETESRFRVGEGFVNAKGTRDYDEWIRQFRMQLRAKGIDRPVERSVEVALVEWLKEQ